METPTPTLEEFRQLYDAAIAFKQDAPWEWMTEDEVFGVRNPETGQIGYVSIMGMRGEHLALGVYLGSEGLDGFWRMERGEEQDNPTFLLEVPQLQASFEDRDVLDDKDRQVIKALGLKFRGRQSWPWFRSYVPGYLPWFVTPEEARFLTRALQQALDVTRRLEENPSLLEPPRRGQYLVRTPTEPGWVDEWVSPPPPPVHPQPPPDQKRLATLRKQFPVQRFSLQVDLFAMPASIKEKDDPRPYMPYSLMVVEAQSGLIVGTELMAPKPSLETVWTQTPARFLDAVTRLGRLPSQIAVRNERIQDLLAPTAAGLGIQIKVSRRLPALDQARTALERWM
jgi:hypothetical protein